jgi:hypothetical protein
VYSKLDHPFHCFSNIFAFFVINNLMRDSVLREYENINLESVLGKKNLNSHYVNHHDASDFKILEVKDTGPRIHADVTFSARSISD